MIPNEVKNYVKGFYGEPPVPIEKEMKRKIIGDDEVITCRPADRLQPALDRIPKDVKPYIESEEDKITYSLFPETAIEFFKNREAKRKEGKRGVSQERMSELEEVAAVSVAVATYLKSKGEVKAVIPIKTKRSISPWVLANRQVLAESGV
jgi:pyruvate/oxaloacetate carboxyltransferase